MPTVRDIASASRRSRPGPLLAVLLVSALGLLGSLGTPCSAGAQRAEAWPPAEKNQGCTWQSGFFSNGISGSVFDSAVYDDGSGPALYVGGDFVSADDTLVNSVARWDGQRWSALGSGLNGTAEALAVYDDGSGPALYVGGIFTVAGGVNRSHIARWDGTQWSSVGGGIGGWVFDLAVYDDGSGPALYAVGGFPTAGTATVSNVARWDGVEWSDVGSGTDGRTYALAVHDDGSGPALYAAGGFQNAGGGPASAIARWDGVSWSEVGGGIAQHNVFDLEVYDDGSGPALFVAGGFSIAGGVNVRNIAKWDGSSWSPLSIGADNVVFALATFDDGGGEALYAGGAFTTMGGLTARHLARWNGSMWSTLGAGANATVRTLLAHNDGSGPSLFAGGDLTSAGGSATGGLARWSGTAWATPTGKGRGHGISGEAGGIFGDGSHISALETYDDGQGTALYAAGRFTVAGGVEAENVARWDGSTWAPVGGGTGGTAVINETVYALEVHDQGNGPELFAGGRFSSAGGQSAVGIAKWNGATWSALGAGVGHIVLALAGYDHGTGPALYAAGSLTSAGGLPVSGIARWDGAAWEPLGTGLDSGAASLAVFDGGEGPELHVGGGFSTAGGIDAQGIAKWNGTDWSPVGGGVHGSVQALAIFDDGSGPALYAGGRFSMAGGLAAANIARWDGTSWAPVGSGLAETVLSLTVHDDGRGAALYAGMDRLYSWDTTETIARWNGDFWEPIAPGLTESRIPALASFDGGQGPELFAGGNFFTVDGIEPSVHIGKWSCGPSGDPSLTIPVAIPTLPGVPVEVPVELATAGSPLASVAFSIDLDAGCLSFDPADTSPADGIPDAIDFPLGPSFEKVVFYDPADGDGEIDILLFAGDPAATSLPDGTLATLTLTATCAPAPGGTFLAPVLFSNDPQPSFADAGAQSVPGSSRGGSVEILAGLRGDCNGDGLIDVADVTACQLEAFDGDGAFWLDVAGGSYGGNPAGCDANADTAVDAGDLSCKARL
ncbi:MAG: hypothetical protein MI919_42845, partial [Holophagales bacterium]|nr:hypothetical protein [Holophagales bacterium]